MPSRARRTFESLRVPHFPAVYASGWIFHAARWGLAFLGAYVVNEATGSPRLVQLTGTAMWSPLLLAGLAGGAVADRFDRRRTVLALFVALVPATAALGLLELFGHLAIWIVFPFMLLVGVGWIIDMTARRALVYDLVGPGQVNNAMALEMFSGASGLALGSLLGGAVIEWLGVGAAYLSIAALLLLAAALMARVPSPPAVQVAVGEPFRETLLAGLRSLSSNPTLVSILGVTVIVNFFHFAYAPSVQLIGVRVGAPPALIGVLAASAGVGMMATSAWVAASLPHRGHAYVLGSAGALFLMQGFAWFETYLGVLVSLLLASACLGLFGATQGALTMTCVPDAMRGRAMGLLSMAIGALPLGMYGLGELAEWLGAPAALAGFNAVGLLALLVWLRLRPEAYRMR